MVHIYPCRPGLIQLFNHDIIIKGLGWSLLLIDLLIPQNHYNIKVAWNPSPLSQDPSLAPSLCEPGCSSAERDCPDPAKKACEEGQCRETRDGQVLRLHEQHVTRFLRQNGEYRMTKINKKYNRLAYPETVLYLERSLRFLAWYGFGWSVLSRLCYSVAALVARCR